MAKKEPSRTSTGLTILAYNNMNRHKGPHLTAELHGIKMNWKEHKKRLLKDPEFKKEYKALAPEYEATSAAIRRRLKRSAAPSPKAK
jgi:hypothetical protein